MVLGASGFIGRWVARLLSLKGAHLLLPVRDRHTAAGVFCAYAIHGDLLDVDLLDPGGALRNLLESHEPAIVFNLAGYGVDPSEHNEAFAYRINAEVPAIICRAMAELEARESHCRWKWKGQRIVHVGSALEYGAVSGALSEQSDPNPVSLYGQSKLAGTNALTDCCREHGVRAVTARLFTVYGPGEHEGRLLPTLLEAARTGDPVKLTAGLQCRDFSYVEDVAEGLLRLGMLEQRLEPVVNLASGRLHSVKEFVETAARILGIQEDRLDFGALPVRPEENTRAPVSNALLRSLLGWVPAGNLHQGIIRAHDCAATIEDSRAAPRGS